MNRIQTLFVALFLCLPGVSEAANWHPAQAERLAEWLDGAANEALPAMAADAAAVRSAVASGDATAIDGVATDRALRLARALRFGTRARTGWEIADEGVPEALGPALDAAIAEDRLDQFLNAQRPRTPEYARLQSAYVAETDPARRATIAINLERWRWMPRALGERYLMVNVPAFEVVLWENGSPVRRWPVIVGKTKTPTPVFSTRVTGMIFNPWWEIPKSIVAESVGALVRNRPAEARRRGYVVMDGRYRQRPGPGNSLGQVKLVMPNPHNVYLHDTPSKPLFDKQVRAFSHGCIRVGGAFDLAATLLAGQPEWDMSRINRVVASGITTPVQIAHPLPVYITYFTAGLDNGGNISIFPDIYNLD